jgi:putative exporter of polyketide antibiotics
LRHCESGAGGTGNDEAWMLEGFLRTLVKVAVASLIVGTILTHFGITIDVLMKELGLSSGRVEELVRRGVAWAMPNMLLGALIIVPLWCLAFLFRPPGQRSE